MTLGVFVALCFTSLAFAFDFPALTGRVVDQAGVMSAESKSDIEAKAKTLEDKSGIQLVVATVKSLQGGDVETYANELFRFWKLGEAKKNNGVLLLVAPNERKVRIEVGYGLEGTLTDALSSVIISSAIIPRFKTKDYSGGIEQRRRRHHQRLERRQRRVAAEGQCAHRGGVVRLRQAISHPVLRHHDLHHLVFDPPCRRSAVGRRRPPRQRRADLHSLWRWWLGWGWRRWRLRWRLFRRRRVVGRRRSVGELVMEFTKQQHEAVSAAIREAEQRTCGQIICVLARSSSAYAHIPILWASALALITPWPLIDFTQWSVQRIFLVQLLVFLIAALIFSWMPVRLLLVPRALQRARAHRAALEQFVVRRVAHTKNRTGVLIFVSLAEHYARIIPDEGIAEKVPNSEWQAAIDAMIAHLRSGDIVAGLTAAIQRCADVLAAHAPPDGSPNELPDRLYLM